jgi:ribosomal 30S subunit maturation factor RimM
MKYAFGLIGIIFLVCLLIAGSTWAQDQLKKTIPASNQKQQIDSRVSDEEKNASQLSLKGNDRADSEVASNLADASLEDDSDAASDKTPGIYYQYDKLGRIVRIERISSP